MALVVKDRVRETTATTGTGTISLAGAVAGFQSFSVIGDGNTTHYAVVSGNDWEVGVGTYTASGATLSRDTILESSNAGAAITLAGTSNVFCTYPAEKSLNQDDIGSLLQGYDADTAKYDDTTANFTGTLQNGGSNVVVDTDIGSTVQAYDADTAKYDDTTANFTGTLQNGGSNVVVDTDIGVTVQGYDADTAKYDDVTANFTGTLQNGGSNVVVDTDIGSTVQGYDADTAKYDDATANFTGTLQQGGSNVLTGNQTITLSGDATGSGTTAITVTVVDDSHNHIISNVDGLQTALDAKAPLASPTFTGTATTPNLTISSAATLRDNTGTYGSIEISGGATGGWEGYSIGGHTVFMSNGGTYGLYDDANNQWGIDAVPAGKTQLRYAGSTKIETTGGGVAVTGTLTATDVTIGGSSVLVDSDIGATGTVGYPNIPAVGTKTTSYTLTTSDVGKYVQIGTGGAITIPNSTFSEGDVVSIFNNTTGDRTITCSITTAYIAGENVDKASVTLATRGLATIFFISATVCVIAGNVS